MSNEDPVSIGVGIDTARYGHHVSFLRTDRLPAAKPFTFAESPAGYAQLRQALERLQTMHNNVHFHVRIDAAGQYAANLEHFLRSLPCAKTVSVGQPKQNRNYCQVHFPKRKADAVESLACARFAIVEHPDPTPATPAPFAQLRELSGALESQVKQTTRQINQLHGRLARVFPELALDVSDLSAGWVLLLLEKYPTPARIAGARPAALRSIPHLTREKADKIQAAARQTVASLQGHLAEGLIRESVRAVRRSQEAAGEFQRLLELAFEELPPGPHRQIVTIPGIGKQTAAALVAKMVDIDRFATPGSVVNYFGILPEEASSGVDKLGRPVPAGTMVMSRKGNDLVRRCLWNAAKSAIVHNPVIRDLYARQRARGKRGDVALGHCMRKLLHLVFAVWKTDRPFAPPPAATEEGPGIADSPAMPEGSANAERPATAPHEAELAMPEGSANAERPATAPREVEIAGGRKGRGPQRQAVTPALPTLPSASSAGNAPGPTPGSPAAGPIDFAKLREQISIEQVLRVLQVWDALKGRGDQRRGPCPIHKPAGAEGRSFSVNLPKNVFRCFDASCGAQGNVLDLWAKSQRMTIGEAARDLAERFGIATE